MTTKDPKKLKEELALLLEEKERRQKYNKLQYVFPDEGPHRRELYKKQLQFFEAGSTFRQRAMIAANRCVAAGTKVTMADGTQKNVEDVSLGELVLAYDIKSDCLVTTKVVDTFKGHANNMVSFTAGNCSVTCTDDHPFLHVARKPRKRKISTIAGLDNNRIVMPYRWRPEVTDPGFSPDVARLIGYLIGDGALTQDCPRFTNKREAYHKDVSTIASSLGLHTRRYGDDAYYSVANGVKGGNPLINLLKELGLWKTNCRTKFIPKELMTAPVEHVKELLVGLMATDGCVQKDKVTYYSVSKELLENLRCLLWRIDVQSYIYLRKYHKGIPQYYLQVRRSDNHKLPIIPKKNNLRQNSRLHVASKHRRAAVKNLQEELPQDIYCITVEHPDHLFVGNGLIMSNTGKSFAGGYEMALHATGLYPDWWKGRKFDKPVNCWAVGVSNIQTKEVVQHILYGDFVDPGTGLIPKDCIDPKRVSRPGVPEAIDTLRVKHFTDGVFDGYSNIMFKSYEQEREKFQGQAIHVIWLDEEPKNPGIYTECLTRIATTDGMLYCTFTPLLGLSDVVLSFMPGGKLPKDGVVKDPETGKPSRKFIVQIDWEEVPHITQDMKEEMLSSYAPYERDARAKGIPQLGSGAIYPIIEDEIVVEPFEIPRHWKRVYGLDVGWNKTAGVWGAIDPNTNVVYLYSEFYQGRQEMAVMFEGIRSRGQWIPGVIDPAAEKLINPTDGRSLFSYYIDSGLELALANNAVEAGLFKTWNLLSTGNLKVFSNLQNWLGEFRIYRRDEHGKIVKRDDHLMDATRYLVMSGIDLAMNEEEADDDFYENNDYAIASSKLQKGASDITGY